jgi:hypothetical protein
VPPGSAEPLHELKTAERGIMRCQLIQYVSHNQRNESEEKEGTQNTFPVFNGAGMNWPKYNREEKGEERIGIENDEGGSTEKLSEEDADDEFIGFLHADAHAV